MSLADKQISSAIKIEVYDAFEIFLKDVLTKCGFYKELAESPIQVSQKFSSLLSLGKIFCPKSKYAEYCELRSSKGLDFQGKKLKSKTSNYIHTRSLT